MKKVLIILIVCFIGPVIYAQSYQVDWYVIASGGGHSQSTNYQIDGTAGQPIVGQSASANYVVDAGFWVSAGIGLSGFQYLPGDANMLAGLWPPQIIGSDVTYLVGYFRGLNQPCLISGFYCSADANGDCSVIGSDVTKLVAYFRGLTQLQYCYDYETVWPSPADCPADAPADWPGCEAAPVTSNIINNGSTMK